MPGVHQAALSLPSSAGQDGMEENKMVKKHGSRNRQFNKAKDAHGSKGKQNIYSLLPISRHCPATLQAAGLRYTEQLFWNTKVIIMNDIGADSNQHLSDSENLLML